MNALPDDPQPWTVLGSTYLSRKPWMTLREDRVQLPGGAVIDDYYVLEYPDWVNITAVDRDGRIILIRQYRHAIGAVHYELPAGVCDATDPHPLETARRELLEETGYGGGEWSHLITLSANPATHANRNHSFLALGVERLQDPQLEATEEIHVHPTSREDLQRLLDSGGILQSLHVAPLLKYLMTTGG
jgi:8-oxo-dGTP pyrophosphatase MutT (NUDIX family)